MIAAEKRHEDDLYAALWKQDEQVKAAREVAETAEQLKRNQGRKSTVYPIFTKILHHFMVPNSIRNFFRWNYTLNPFLRYVGHFAHPSCCKGSTA